jgi:WD40 repeat protein/tetratricopeptide (TPR) repeat protein
VLPDVEVAHHWDGWPDDTVTVAFDADLRQYARLDREGGVTICRLAEGVEEVTARLPPSGLRPSDGLWMSPDGGLVARWLAGERNNAGRLQVWRVNGITSELVLELDEAARVSASTLVFRPDSRQIAVIDLDGSVSVYEVPNGRRAWHKALGMEGRSLAFHPWKNQLAVGCGAAVRRFDLEGGAEAPPLVHPNHVSSVAWDPNGRRLAVGCDDAKIHIWDAETAIEVMVPWGPGAGAGIRVAFNHAGDRLASSAWDNQTRLWDTATGRLMLTIPTNIGLDFSRDDALLGWDHLGNQLRVYRVAAGRELQVLRRRGATAAEGINWPQPHADSRTLAAWAGGRLTFFDLDAGAEMETFPRAPAGIGSVHACVPEGWIVQATHHQALLWPARPGATLDDPWRVGPPQPLAVCFDQAILKASASGRVLAEPLGRGALVSDRDRPGRRVMLGPQYDVRHCAVSPDGRWVFTGSHTADGHSSPAHVWEAATGRHVHAPPLEGCSRAVFSSDGRWLAITNEHQGSTLWETGTWREGLHVGDSEVAFSRDGQLLALSDEVGVIRLLKPETGREVTRLTGPEPQGYPMLSFTADGTRLAAACSTHKALYVWDLLRLRDGLRELGLDQDWLPLPAATRAAPRAPRPVEIVAADWANPTKLRQAEWVQCTLTLATSPFDAAVNARLGALLLDEGHDAAALSRLTLSLATRPDHLATRLLRAKAAVRVGSWLLARTDLDVYLATQPGDAEARALRARTELGLGRPAEALADWDAAAAWYGDDPEFRLGRVEALVALGREAEAEAERRRAWSVAQERITTLLMRAAFLVTGPPGTRDARRALALAQLVVTGWPNDATALNVLGMAHYRLGHYREAIAALEHSLRDGQGLKDGFDLYFLAMCHHRLGDASVARACYDRAVGWVRTHTDSSIGDGSESEAFRAEAEEVLRTAAIDLKGQ